MRWWASSTSRELSMRYAEVGAAILPAMVRSFEVANAQTWPKHPQAGRTRAEYDSVVDSGRPVGISRRNLMHSMALWRRAAAKQRKKTASNSASPNSPHWAEHQQ